MLFGEGLDDLHCGYCGHRVARRTLGVDAGPDGSFFVDHFKCRDCALERDTSLEVCYIRLGGGARRHGSTPLAYMRSLQHMPLTDTGHAQAEACLRQAATIAALQSREAVHPAVD